MRARDKRASKTSDVAAEGGKGQVMGGPVGHLLGIKFCFKYNRADLKGFEQRSDKNVFE